MALKTILAVAILAVFGWPTVRAEREMAGEAAAALATLQTVQALLSVFESTLAIGGYLCPSPTPIDTVTSLGFFDFVIVGGGTAGLVMANRLTECSSNTVLVLEEGGCPTLESNCLGYFTMTPLTSYDYNFTTVNDRYSAQNLQGGVVGATAGMMLGGSSGLHHGIMARGSIRDFDSWATASGDPSWSYEGGFRDYFIKSETIDDEYILAEFGEHHGSNGPTRMRRQTSSENERILSSFANLGYRIVNDTNNNIAQGVTEPLLSIGSDNLRQSSLVSYLYPVINRPNLYVLTGATVTRINFINNRIATGVSFTYNGSSYTVNARDEVILSAGAIRSPQLLMLSGVGPSSHLSEFGIPVIADLPGVGQNLQDHVGAGMVFGLDYSSAPAAAPNPFAFPVPMTINYVNLDDRNAEWAKTQSINLLFPNDSSGIMQLCMNVFKYSEAVCQRIFEANVGRRLLMCFANHLHPQSRGSIRLNSTNISDQPLITLGLLSDGGDLIDLGEFLRHMASIARTPYFTSIGGEFLDFGLCANHEPDSTSYWQCYALSMSSTMWHYSGTLSMGSVTDSHLRVLGLRSLRVVDASVFPTVPGANINAAVLAMAEKAADLVKSDLNLQCSA